MLNFLFDKNYTRILVGNYHEDYWLVDFELHKGDFFTNIFNSKGIKTNIKFLMKIIVVLEKKKSMFLFYWMLILVILMVVIYKRVTFFYFDLKPTIFSFLNLTLSCQITFVYLKKKWNWKKKYYFLYQTMLLY